MKTSIMENDKLVSVDVLVFDPHYNKTIITDLYKVKDSRGDVVVIAQDASTQLYAVIKQGDRLVLNNSDGFGTMNRIDHTVTGWNFDREPLCTTPVGFKSSGYYAEK